MSSRFSRYQLSCYIISCFSMALYFLHFSLGLPLPERVLAHKWCEIILILLRGLNEYIHGKFDRNDMLHHSTFLLGSWIVFNVSECEGFGFLLSHMQCLHFPMVIWYAGCRRIIGPEDSRQRTMLQAACAATFSPAWLLCVAYRATIMLSTIITSAGMVSTLITAIFTLLFLSTTGIDLSWSGYFFSILGRPSTASIAAAVIAGSFLGAAALQSGRSA